MTPVQIKQIAEEYREDIINRMGIPKDFISADVRKGLASDCTAFLNWLSTRYCVVERSKVVEKYKDYKNMLEQEYLCDNGEVERDFWEDGAIALEQLFGSEAFNKKEDEEI